MSQENAEIVTRMNRAWNSGDHDDALAYFHPDVEWRDLQHARDAPERVRGIAAVREIWDQWDAAFDEFNADVEEYIDAGDKVVTVTRWRARGKGSGMALDLNAAEVVELKDGRVIRVTLGYVDKSAALKAVGLAE